MRKDLGILIKRKTFFACSVIVIDDVFDFFVIRGDVVFTRI